MAFQIIRADLDNEQHIAAIKALWNNNLTYISPGRLEWLYKENPAGRAYTWLALDDKEDSVVGCASVLPRKVMVDGTVRTMGIAVDFAIDAKYRVFGPALPLQRAISEQVWESGIELMFAFPNEASQGVFKRVGYQQIGESQRVAYLVRSADKFADRISFSILAKPAARVVDTLLMARSYYDRLTPGRKTGSLRTSEPDKRWQLFWERKAAAVAFGGVQDLANVTWRYAQCPYQQYQFFGLLDEDKQLAAYLVYSEDSGVALVDDIQYLEISQLRPLFARFWQQMRRGGSCSINLNIVSSHAVAKALIAARLVRRETARWGGVLIGPDAGVEWKKLLGEREWYLGNGEVDL